METKTRIRARRGTPEGGQFAAEPRTESQVELTATFDNRPEAVAERQRQRRLDFALPPKWTGRSRL